jgi:hypothetical protein
LHNIIIAKASSSQTNTMIVPNTTMFFCLLSLSILLGLASSFHASSPLTARRRPALALVRPSSRGTVLFSAANPLLDPTVGHPPSEAEATYLMAKAQECAFSDSATVADAKYYLRELVHIQSGCVVGTLASRSLCENQEKVADIVVHLQSRLDASVAGSSAAPTDASSSSM